MKSILNNHFFLFCATVLWKDRYNSAFSIWTPITITSRNPDIKNDCQGPSGTELGVAKSMWAPERFLCCEADGDFHSKQTLWQQKGCEESPRYEELPQFKSPNRISKDQRNEDSKSEYHLLTLPSTEPPSFLTLVLLSFPVHACSLSSPYTPRSPASP